MVLIPLPAPGNSSLPTFLSVGFFDLQTEFGHKGMNSRNWHSKHSRVCTKNIFAKK